MAKILCIGVATLDIVNEVSEYPAEDDELRVLSQKKQRGGNASNTAVVLSQLGHQCSWAGTLVNETDCQLILDDFDHYQINYQFCQFLARGKIPTSYIVLSQKTGSRTICHYRDLPEYSSQAFRQIDLESFEWLHFEGRNIEQSHIMLSYVKTRHPHISISIEFEKVRKNIETLIQFADIIIFSRHYANTQGFTAAEQFCRHIGQQYADKMIFCAWGNSGAAAFVDNNYYWQEAFLVETIDSLAAGDVFNASLIDQQIKKSSIEQTLINACQLAAKKCTQKGLVLSESCS